MVSIKRRCKRSSRAKRNISMMNSSLESKNVTVAVILKYTRQKCDRHTAAAHGKIFQYRDCVCTECVIKLPRRSLLNEYHCSTFAIAFALNLVLVSRLNCTRSNLSFFFPFLGKYRTRLSSPSEGSR